MICHVAPQENDDEGGSGHEMMEEIKINKIVACKSMTLKEWKGVCSKMNTTEITNGGRWIQETEEDAEGTNGDDDDDGGVDMDKYEERFLVKWDQLSFLHCSWETERDLVEFCEGAKGRLSIFFGKAEGGLLYDVDERLDGVS